MVRCLVSGWACNFLPGALVELGAFALSFAAGPRTWMLIERLVMSKDPLAQNVACGAETL